MRGRNLLLGFFDWIYVAVFSSETFRFRFVNRLLWVELYEFIAAVEASSVEIKNVFDIGANRGEWTKGFKRKYPDKSFFLFEANRSHAASLAALNEWYSIGVLSDCDKIVSFYSTDGTGDSYLMENSKHYRDIRPSQVRADTLDALVAREKIPKPDFMKIDTQGSELDVLRGGESCLENSKIVLLECPVFPYNRGAPSMKEYVDTMIGYGFYPAKCLENHAINGILIQIDILFVRRDVLSKVYKDFDDFV